jgi:hypothetical protein
MSNILQENALLNACSHFGRVESVRMLREKGGMFSSECETSSWSFPSRPTVYISLLRGAGVQGRCFGSRENTTLVWMIGFHTCNGFVDNNALFFLKRLTQLC